MLDCAVFACLHYGVYVYYLMNQVWKLLHRNFKAELTGDDYAGLLNTTSVGGAHLEVYLDIRTSVPACMHTLFVNTHLYIQSDACKPFVHCKH
jgi:hypothetical protein